MSNPAAVVEGFRVNGETIKGEALVSIAVTKIGARYVEVTVYDPQRPIMVRINRRAAATLAAALATAAGPAEPEP